jgi:hypothetical protein
MPGSFSTSKLEIQRSSKRNPGIAPIGLSVALARSGYHHVSGFLSASILASLFKSVRNTVDFVFHL